jgi:hypothetical protein
MSQQTVVKITQDSPSQQTITVFTQPQAPTQQQKHTKQSFNKRYKQTTRPRGYKFFAKRPALYKIGDKVKIDFDYGRLGAASKPMKGKIIAIPNDGTIISNVCDYDVVKKAYNKQNIQWIKNNKNVLESVETFEDQPATGSVWYFDDSVSYRKCFVLLQNGVISLIPEFMIKSDSFFGWLS